MNNTVQFLITTHHHHHCHKFQVPAIWRQSINDCYYFESYVKSGAFLMFSLSLVISSFNYNLASVAIPRSCAEMQGSYHFKMGL